MNFLDQGLMLKKLNDFIYLVNMSLLKNIFKLKIFFAKNYINSKVNSINFILSNFDDNKSSNSLPFFIGIMFFLQQYMFFLLIIFK
jgi:hypothetical protein